MQIELSVCLVKQLEKIAIEKNITVEELIKTMLTPYVPVQVVEHKHSEDSAKDFNRHIFNLYQSYRRPEKAMSLSMFDFLTGCALYVATCKETRTVLEDVEKYTKEKFSRFCPMDQETILYILNNVGICKCERTQKGEISIHPLIHENEVCN